MYCLLLKLISWWNKRPIGPHRSHEKQLKFATWFLKCFFKFRQFICYFVLYLSLKKAWTFIWTYLNSLNPEMLCAKFSLGYLLLRRIFFLFRLYVFAIALLWGPSFKQSAHGCSLLSLVKIGSVVLEKKIF